MAYHAAEGMSLEPARELIGRVEVAASRGAGEGIAHLVDELRADGHEPVASVVIGELRELPGLERILASHALLHAAEGVLYREVVADASVGHGLATTFLPAAQVSPAGAASVRWTIEKADAWLRDVGRSVGPPWQKDHKQATLAALTGLGGSGRGAERGPLSQVPVPECIASWWP
jgi:hypothetical protein